MVSVFYDQWFCDTDGLLRIPAIPITHSGFIRSPVIPNARVSILTLVVIGISYVRHCQWLYAIA